MTISSLLLTLSRDSASRARAIEALALDPRLTLGELTGGRLPVVLEARSANDSESACEALLELPGVEFVDLVAVHFDVAEDT